MLLSQSQPPAPCASDSYPPPPSLSSTFVSPVIIAYLWGLTHLRQIRGLPQLSFFLLPGILQICGSFAPSVVMEEQEKGTHR